MPDFVNEFEQPDGLELAAERRTQSHYELEGDLFALRLVNLKGEGLEEYSSLVNELKVTQSTTSDTHSRKGSMSSDLSSSITQQAVDLDQQMPDNFLCH